MDCLLDINKKLLLLSVITSMFCSCHSTKNYDYKHIECHEIPKEAVNIAIADYSKRLKRQENPDNVVAVQVRVYPTTTDWFYIAMIPWQLYVDNDSGKCYLTNRFLVSWLDENMGRIPPDWIPSDYLEKDGILYVWHDLQVVMTENFKSILAKYDLLHYPEDDAMTVTLDGSYISYIFCKTNYKRRYYRRVKASFITPLPACRCQ